MTQEEKDILLKDLCARLPYGVKCDVIKRSVDGEMLFIRRDLELTVNNIKEIVTNSMYEIKPNLFPLSSMTDEQKKEFDQLIELELKAINNEIDHIQATTFEVDFYNKHHFDYRGLIEKDLAIDATGLNIY